MAAPINPDKLNILHVELTFFKRGEGPQVIAKLSDLSAGYKYFINRTACGKEQAYNKLVTSGFPPGHPYLELLMSDETNAATAGKDKPAISTRQADTDYNLKPDILIYIDNRCRALELATGTVSFSKTHATSAKPEYYITKIRCRPTDIRELFTDAGIKPGTPVYDALLDE